MSQDNAMEMLSLLYAVGEQNVETLNSGSALTVSTPNVASVSVITLNAATPALTMPAPEVAGARKVLYLVQDGTGGRAPTWAGATINWLAGSAPTLSTAIAAIDKITLESLDGTTWEGQAALAGGGSGLTPAFSSPGLVSGTAKQDATGQWSTWYISITGGASGTVGVAIGPTSGVADSIIPVVANNAVQSQVLVVRLPPSWYIKTTVSVATITGATVVTG